MTIGEMHVWFRQYAQQMGMQNVRAILPEQIDLLINSAISDTINQIITQNIGVTNDRIVTDNSKIGQINALRSLYKVVVVNAIPSTKGGINNTNPETPFVIGNETTIRRIIAKIANFGSLGSFDYLYLVDLSMSYSDAVETGGEKTKVTNYFPVRLIDDAYLSDTLNDFILRPRLRTPVAVLYNDNLDIYVDELHKNPLYSPTQAEQQPNYDVPEYLLPEGLNPYKLRVSYIAKPLQVRYAADLGGENIDCDLPEYLHVDILKHAVDLYRIAVNGTLSAAQQAEENQQREVARNNYRPSDGTQRQQ